MRPDRREPTLGGSLSHQRMYGAIKSLQVLNARVTGGTAQRAGPRAGLPNLGGVESWVLDYPEPVAKWIRDSGDLDPFTHFRHGLQRRRAQ